MIDWTWRTGWYANRMVCISVSTFLITFRADRSWKFYIWLLICSLHINKIISISFSTYITSMKLTQFNWTSRPYIPTSSISLICITPSHIDLKEIFHWKSTITPSNRAWPFSFNQIIISCWTSMLACNYIS